MKALRHRSFVAVAIRVALVPLVLFEQRVITEHGLVPLGAR